MQQVMECVQHLHEKGLVHGDIKMLNVVRLALDNRLRLIDLDAAAKISVKPRPRVNPPSQNRKKLPIKAKKAASQMNPASAPALAAS